MKKLHLVSNAHLDPAWLWRWNEGLAEAISTFRVAADFCEEYDGYIFNHNEALLYEWVEEHEPALFARIQKLVKEGKWNIIGGWYLQPDCVMTSGESLLSQIAMGRKYFKEKFGVEPKIAMNVDSFGHTRGLVQILNKTGYEAYLSKRPEWLAGSFLWRGFDASTIPVHSLYDGYGSLKGEAVKKINEHFSHGPEREESMCMWGIGNHGGGASREDLEAIAERMKQGDIEMLHSTPEAFFATLDRTKLRTVSESLISSMVGCYTSMVRMKQAHTKLENQIAMTEKIMSYAALATDADYNADELLKAKKAIAFCQFHDVLPGSGIKMVEEDGLRTLAYGSEICDKLFTKAFFKLCQGQRKGNRQEIPVMIFNPHPYPIEGDFEMSFMLEDQNWNEGQKTVATVYDENGNALPSQNEKPNCTFNLDWPQKVSFHATLAPASISRFDCHLEVKSKADLPVLQYPDDKIEVANDQIAMSIDRKTGLFNFSANGKTLIENGGALEYYRDCEDAWAMTTDNFRQHLASFELMSDAEACDFVGYPDDKTPNVRVVEDGDVRTKVQAFFKYNRSTAMVEYTMPKNSNYMDVDILVFSGEPNKMLKYHVDTAFEGVPVGETAFGREELFHDEREAVCHKWCGIHNAEDRVYIINRGTHGGSFTGHSMKISLLRTPIYSAHTIGPRQLAPHDRWCDHMDMGERRFSFRITADKHVDRMAQAFNEEPFALSFFPSGEGRRPAPAVTLDNERVLLSSMRKTDSGYQITLYNTTIKPETTHVSIPMLGYETDLAFGRYELKIIDIPQK